MLKESTGARKNIENLYNARKAATDFLNEFTSRASEARCKKGTGLKTLTHKQTHQRLPIALVQIKAGNNSQSLLNEIRQMDHT